MAETDWFSAIPAILLALTMIFLPGVPIAGILRFRGISFLAISITASLAVIGISSIALPYFGADWGMLGIAAVVLVASIILWGLRSIPALNRLAKPYGSWAGWYQYFGVLVATVVIAVSFLVVTGSAGAISQTYDVIFHYSLTQYIADTGNASPLLMDMIWQTAPAFYPSLWQGIAALISPLVGAIAANNILVLVLMSMLWPLAATFMVQVILGDRKRYLLLTGVLVAAFPAFPFLFADWGALYPSLMSYCLIPIGFAAVVSLCRLAHSPLSVVTAVIVLLGTSFAMGVAQPSAIYSLLVLAVVPVAVWFTKTIRTYRLTSVRGILLVITALIGAALFALVWSVGINGVHWQPNLTPSQSMGDVLFNAPPGRLPGLVVSALAVIGAVIVWKQVKLRWVLAVYLIVATLYVFASSLPIESLRHILTGIWYTDNRRIMAFLPVVVLLLAVLGASRLFSWIREKGFKNMGKQKYAATFLIVLMVASQIVGMNYARFALWKEYEFNEASDLITPDEYAAFGYVAKNVPEDAVIVGNPWTGTSLVYPITRHDVLFQHVTGSYSSEKAVIAQHLNEPDQEVCAVLADFNVSYALDFGERIIFDFPFGDLPSQVTYFDGLNNLESSNILTEVFSSGEAKLYQVTGCK